MSETIIKRDNKNNFLWKLIVIFLLFSCVIIITGIYYYHYERNRIFLEQEKSLTAIATLKIKQISQWYSDKLADAVVIKDNEPLVSRIKQFFKNENQTGIRKEIKIWLEALNTQFDYNSVALLDTSLKVEIATSNADPLADDSIRKELNNVIRYHKIIMTDLHRTGTNQAIRMDLLVPLFDSLGKEQNTIGLIILCIDPDKILFPLVQSWPTPSRSSETLILRREGDSVIYLNELRHRKNTALNLKFPLSDMNLLASKAVNGFEGVTEGFDYRKIPVIGALSKIQGLPWYMVAKTDKEEILAPFKRYSVITIVVIVLLILINGFVFGFWIWQQKIRSYKIQLKSEISIRELEERFTTAFRMSPVSVTISSVNDNKFIDINNTFLNDMGYTREEVIGRTARELDIWADENERLWIINEINERGKIFGKVISYKTRTGKILYGLSSMSVVNVNGEPCNLSTVVNVTDARTAERKLAEQYFTLKGITESSRGPIFSLDKTYCYTSFNKVHSNVIKFLYGTDIEIGKNMLNYQTNDDDRLKAKANLDRALAGEFVEESAWSGEDLISRRFFEVTHNPIFNDVNEVIGVAVSARDLTERKLLDEKLRETNEYLSNLINYANAPIIVWDASLLITRFNHAFENLSGYSSDQVIGKKIDILFPKEEIKSSLSLIKEAISGERWETVEIEILRKDGDSRMVLWNSANIHDKDGKKVIATIAQGHDITKRKQAEMELRESEMKFRQTFDLSPIGIVMVGLNKKFLRCNNAFSHSLGYKMEELVGKTITDVTHPEDIIIGMDDMAAIAKGEIETSHVQKRYLRKDGEIVWGDVLISLIRNNSAEPQYFLAIIQDITESKKIVEALRENEKRLREAQDMAHLGFWLWDIKTGNVEWSDEVFKIFCLDPATFKPQINSILELSPWPEENQRDKELINKAIESHNPGTYEQRFLRPDKSIGYYYSTFRGSYDDEGDLISIVGTILDITERKLAEDALRESEDKFKYVFDHSLIAKSITLPSGEINVNRAFCDMLGYQPEELKKLNWADISHPDDIKQTNDSLNLILSGKKDSVRFTKRYIHKNGSIIWADIGTSLRRDANNNPQYFMTSVNDITERKAAEDELRIQSEIMSHMAEAVYLVRLEDGIIVFANSRFEELFGYEPGEMTGKPVSIVNAPTDKSPAAVATEIISELEKNGFWTGEVLNLKKDGTVFWSHANVAIFDHSKFGKVLVSVQQDITERKYAESQIKKLNEDLENRVIQRTELLEAANKELEAFSYSVSHDLRAPLRSVHGFTKILLEDYEAKLDEEGKRICGIISSSATQMGELIDDLLSFSRIGRSSMNPSEIDMKKMVRAVFEGMTSPAERKRIKLIIGKLQKAFGDVTLFGQVWTNLISNAIKYSSKNDISEISIGSEIAGDTIIYFIKDNGVGFDMQYAHKLFGVFQRLHSEADFEGNGVGLAIVQRIVLKHGGKVWAKGEVGKGARFYFSLPAEGDGQQAKGDRKTKGPLPDARHPTPDANT